MFYFVVRYLRWLAPVPGLPHLFDAVLVTQTSLFHRARLLAMERLEAEALRLPGIRLKVHRFGGIEFVNHEGRELGHLHGHGLLDVMLDPNAARSLISSGAVRPHHVFPDSRWISFQLKTEADATFAMELLVMANEGSERQ